MAPRMGLPLRGYPASSMMISATCLETARFTASSAWSKPEHGQIASLGVDKGYSGALTRRFRRGLRRRSPLRPFRWNLLCQVWLLSRFGRRLCIQALLQGSHQVDNIARWLRRLVVLSNTLASQL